MGKRIIQQRRGRGSSTYRIRRKAFIYRVSYPNSEGKGKVIRIFKSPAHSSPLLKIKTGNEIFYNLAAEKVTEGQEIIIGKGDTSGDIIMLKNAQPGQKVYNIELSPGRGGKLVRAAGTSALITKIGKKIKLKLASGKEIEVDGRCRATLGIVSGGGKKEKPFIGAGKKFYNRKLKGKLWPRTSAVKMNVVDHPFGSGRGKNVAHGQKGKIPKRNAPPGAKVGILRPKRVGRKKR
jgi:large subunit ribosomal protein L2